MESVENFRFIAVSPEEVHEMLVELAEAMDARARSIALQAAEEALKEADPLRHGSGKSNAMSIILFSS